MVRLDDISKRLALKELKFAKQFKCSAWLKKNLKEIN